MGYVTSGYGQGPGGSEHAAAQRLRSHLLRRRHHSLSAFLNVTSVRAAGLASGFGERPEERGEGVVRGEAPPASRVAFPQGERGAKGGASGAHGARVEGRRTAGRAPAPETARSALGARGPGPSERRGVSPPPPPQDDVDAQRRATEACCGRAHCPPASSLAPDVRTME